MNRQDGHQCFRHGVYVAGPDDQLVFRPLGRLKTDMVADVVQITKVRVLKVLERRGVVRVSPDALEVDDSFPASDPVLAQLAAVAVAGLPPAGPADRKREPVLLAPAPLSPSAPPQPVATQKASSAICATKASGPHRKSLRQSVRHPTTAR